MGKQKKNINKIILVYFIVSLAVTYLFYMILPKLLNYPPNSTDNNFQKEIDGLTYTWQYIIMIIIGLTFSFIILYNNTNKLKKLLASLAAKDISKNVSIDKIKQICFSTPYTVYYMQILAPLVLMPVVFFLIGASPSAILKISISIVLSFTLAAIINFVFSQKIFNNILIELHKTFKAELSHMEEKKHTIFYQPSLRYNLFLELIPLILVALGLTSLIAYTQTSREKGNIYYQNYHATLFNTFNTDTTYESIDDVIALLENVPLGESSDSTFIIDEYGNTYNQELSPFFIKYTIEQSDSQQGRTYDYYCVDVEGSVIKLKVNDTYYYVGIMYSTSPSIVLAIIILSDILLLAITTVVLLYIANHLSKEITRVSNSLKGISDNKDISLSDSICVASEDEIGALISAFNDIQKMTKGNIEQIHANQDLIVEKERLASLGQMIGGIAHNLKTPIMSIAGAAEALSDLINEYDNSIGDSEVTVEDHHEIAKDMMEWIEKTRTHLSYMSDVITAIKGQAVAFSDEISEGFTIDELVKHIDILMKHELSNALIKLEKNIDIYPETEVKGNINSLVQVVNNIISNAIQAYNGKQNQIIELSLYKTKVKEKEFLIIKIEDNAGGLPDKVKEKLFKEMITTKGKNGTGLGLFMSYSNIRAHFSGRMWAESKAGVGTAFYIEIPL